ncbi:MAG: DUF4405 domain-containing protein [Oligoflexia bacterium]|nr:DUF4405 domain-containing protein [Oligoflexia bacterium]
MKYKRSAKEFLVLLASTGFLLHHRLPHGSGRLTVLELTRHPWGDIHFYLSIVFLALSGLK